MDEFLKKEISINSLSYKSYKLFKRFGISTVYLQMNPAEWNNPTNRSAKSTIDLSQIVNDSSEEGVKLVEDFNNKFTEND